MQFDMPLTICAHKLLPLPTNTKSNKRSELSFLFFSLIVIFRRVAITPHRLKQKPDNKPVLIFAGPSFVISGIVYKPLKGEPIVIESFFSFQMQNRQKRQENLSTYFPYGYFSPRHTHKRSRRIKNAYIPQNVELLKRFQWWLKKFEGNFTTHSTNGLFKNYTIHCSIYVAPAIQLLS